MSSGNEFIPPEESPAVEDNMLGLGVTEPPVVPGEKSKAETLLEKGMLAFMDELTELTRRTNIVVTSDGSVDVPVLRMVSPQEARRGRYVFFWKHTTQTYPCDMIWDNSADTQHLVDI